MTVSVCICMNNRIAHMILFANQSEQYCKTSDMLTTFISIIQFFQILSWIVQFCSYTLLLCSLDRYSQNFLSEHAIEKHFRSWKTRRKKSTHVCSEVAELTLLHQPINLLNSYVRSVEGQSKVVNLLPITSPDNRMTKAQWIITSTRVQVTQSMD